MSSFTLKSLLIIALSASTTLASPLNLLQSRQDCADTCGSTCYSQSDIDTAVQQGFSDLQSGQNPDKYPHQYKDYEDFSFPDQPPFYEFPILASERSFTGGKPGADRVVFDGNGNFEGVITHQGASGNDFVQCVAGQ